MTLHPTSRPDSEEAEPLKDDPSSVGEEIFTPEAPTDVTVLTKMLAAVGGGTVSQGLALDLVLNGFVEQARKVTRATGAAIALVRDGQMICRATTGNAPDLGVRVETESGISGACLITGNVQLCSDTDIDPRVNAEACRRLNVRSMLMTPISDGKQNLGIIEVFAAQPNAFNEEDVRTLQSLAQRVAASKKASDETLGADTAAAEKADVPLETQSAPAAHSLSSEAESLPSIPEESNRPDLLTSVLVVLVIAVAIVLGVVIGVGFTKKNAKRVPAQNATPSASSVAQDASGSSGQEAVAPTADASQSPSSSSTPPIATLPAALEPPVGGLIVSQNGKVLYRSDAPAGGQSPGKSVSRLVHRVDPAYPEAARAQRIEGSVVLNAHVSGDGSVGEVEILSGDPLLAQAATQAVKQWRYHPYLVNGEPIERQERITVKFSLPPG